MRPLVKSKYKETMWSSNWNVVIASLFLSVFLGLYVLTSVHLDPHTAPPMAVARRFELTKGLCQDLILSNDTRLIGQKRYIEETDTYEKYRGQDCQYVNQAYFHHPHPTAEEMDMRIAFVIVAYKGAGLLERLLRAIYMPQNIYCLHLDKKSPEIFKRAVHSFVRCLPNVFVTKKLVDVVWGHISVLEAELNCMEELLDSSVPWKYLITLVAQDFPLYDNKGIVQGLKQLNGLNNIQSYTMPSWFGKRADYVWTLKKTGKGVEHYGYTMERTNRKKPPTPHNITIMKGWNHIAATRKFVEFALHDKVATDFYEWLADIKIPDEVFFSSLQRHPGTPGGYSDNENPEWIMRAFGWENNGNNHQCFGQRIRENCWLSIKDLRWVLDKRNIKKLFTQKIPFVFEENLVACLPRMIDGRVYPS
ncbi:N-acetyllactosaminide beta-1,6-N-acetylglucosaminyl-transferase-like [Acropora palmata]|uniref:N-acetyllactosaminide beta-1,6-N-acetylglucosaminyl-transferase-like n=1 Tax=Acropora palmata TaxID=6131 RepID=UPI003DA0B832